MRDCRTTWLLCLREGHLLKHKFKDGLLQSNCFIYILRLPSYCLYLLYLLNTWSHPLNLLFFEKLQETFVLGLPVSWVNAASACPFWLLTEQNFITRGLLGMRWISVMFFLTLDFKATSRP